MGVAVTAAVGVEVDVGVGVGVDGREGVVTDTEVTVGDGDEGVEAVRVAVGDGVWP